MQLSSISEGTGDKPLMQSQEETVMKISQINANRPWWAVELNLVVEKGTWDGKPCVHVEKVYFFERDGDGNVYSCLDDGDRERFAFHKNDLEEDKIFALWYYTSDWMTGRLIDNDMTTVNRFKRDVPFDTREEWLNSRKG